MDAYGFWLANRDRIQKRVHDERYSNPNFPKAVVSSWGMETVATECWNIFNEQGVFIPRTRLRQLLEAVISPDPDHPLNVYEEASRLLDDMGDDDDIRDSQHTIDNGESSTV